jgi:hypothetical protein
MIRYGRCSDLLNKLRTVSEKQDSEFVWERDEPFRYNFALKVVTCASEGCGSIPISES